MRVRHLLEGGWIVTEEMDLIQEQEKDEALWFTPIPPLLNGWRRKI